MSISSNLALPYLEAAQAQKHVTVNEAFRHIDVLTQLTVESVAETSPPISPVDGEQWIVAPGADGDWTGHEGEIAARVDGAWMFHVPKAGWRAWVKDQRAGVIYDGAMWVTGPAFSTLALSPNGAMSQFSILEIDHTIVAGAYNETSLEIPDRAIVFGISGRVLAEVTGPGSWTLGVAADPQRYASWVGSSEGSTVNGVSGTPTAYYGTTPVRVTASGADFIGGQIRLALHYLILGTPDA